MRDPLIKTLAKEMMDLARIVQEGGSIWQQKQALKVRDRLGVILGEIEAGERMALERAESLLPKDYLKKDMW